MTIVNQPCYCTREMVRRALDVKQASYTNEQIDRAICSATDEAEDFCGRVFYPNDTTKKFDWPNFQYSYPWRVWLDKNELAAPATQITTGSLLPSPIVIPINAFIFRPVNYGPPYTHIELRRDMNYSFGNNTTPQLDIAMTGTFGYWLKTRPSGTMGANALAGDSTITVSDGISVGVGDVLIAGAERMLVIDSNFTDTGVTYSGMSTSSKADNIVAVPDGTKFKKGEVLQFDSEWALILNIQGNNLFVNRAYDGSILTEHTGGTIYARRLLSVQRGALGTTAISHSSGDSLVVNDVPGLVRDYCVAEALVRISQEPTAYGGSSAPQKATTQGRGGFSVSDPIAGAGLPDIRQRLENSKFRRSARSRVI